MTIKDLIGLMVSLLFCINYVKGQIDNVALILPRKAY
jgi:hypothetical protein